MQPRATSAHEHAATRVRACTRFHLFFFSFFSLFFSTQQVDPGAPPNGMRSVQSHCSGIGRVLPLSPARRLLPGRAPRASAATPGTWRGRRAQTAAGPSSGAGWRRRCRSRSQHGPGSGTRSGAPAPPAQSPAAAPRRPAMSGAPSRWREEAVGVSVLSHTSLSCAASSSGDAGLPARQKI